MAIKFKKNSTWRQAENDIRTFRSWQKGEISTNFACEMVAHNNDLEFVSEEDFIESAELLGYRRRNNER